MIKPRLTLGFAVPLPMGEGRADGTDAKGEACIFGAVILTGLMLMTSPVRAAVPNQPSVVTVQGKQLILQKRLRDGTLSPPTSFTIKGMDWNPDTFAPVMGPDPTLGRALVPYGYFYDDVPGNRWRAPGLEGHDLLTVWSHQQFQQYYQQDIALMAQMHVNTVRVFSDFGDDPAVYGPILDAFYNNHIMVIITVAAAAQEITSGHYLTVIQNYKNHPAVLMFAIGNEWNLNNLYGTYPNLAAAEAAVSSVVPAIKAQDVNHPICSSMGDAGTTAVGMQAFVAAVPNVDIWAWNVYRGMSFNTFFTDWATTGKPFYFSEFGIDSFNTTAYSIVSGAEAQVTAGSQDQAAQSAWDLALWGEIQANLSSLDPAKYCAGGALFSWNDQLYEVGNYNLGMGDIPPSPGGGYAAYDWGGFKIPGASPDDVTNEEYFGIVGADRSPKEAYAAMQAYYPTVAPLPMTSLAIAPSSVTVHYNQTQVLTAEAQDVFENPVVPQPSVTWSISPAAGASIDASGRFTSFVTSGAYIVTAQSGAFSQTIAVTVEPSSPADFSALRVYPSPWRSNLHQGRDITFDGLTDNATVKIFTLSGHWVQTLGPAGERVTWNLKNSAGDLVASGLYFYLITNNQGQRTRGKFAIIR